jgi:hypothetical protein
MIDRLLNKGNRLICNHNLMVVRKEKERKSRFSRIKPVHACQKKFPFVLDD